MATEDPFVQEEDDVESQPAPGEALSEDQVRLALRRVKDPEIGLNIVDLGLIYEVSVDGADVNVDMSLTSPGCPAGPQILHEAEDRKSTRLNSSHLVISYAVFCLKKKNRV